MSWPRRLGMAALLLGALSGPSAVASALPAAAPAAFIALKPSCGPPAPTTGTILALTYTIEVVGRSLPSAVDIVFNPGRSQQAFPVQPDSSGNLDTIIHPTLVAAGTYVVVAQADFGVVARTLFAVPCPPTPPPVSPPPPRGTPVPVLNPTLTLTPAVGPPGTVTVASGLGFPASAQVQLAWSQGILNPAASVVTTDATGSFTVVLLIFPHDELGARVLTAVSITPPNSRFTFAAFADAPFLVVPGAVQPNDFSWRH